MGGAPNYLVFYNSAYRDDCAWKYASVKYIYIYIYIYIYTLTYTKSHKNSTVATFCCNVNTTDLSRDTLRFFDKSHQRDQIETIIRVSLFDDTFHQCDAKRNAKPVNPRLEYTPGLEYTDAEISGDRDDVTDETLQIGQLSRMNIQKRPG